MKRTVEQAKGRASYKDGILTVTTLAKRGKKTVEVQRHYQVTNANPDRRVAHPAWTLTKGLVKDGVFTSLGEVWHVSVNEWGPACDCPDRLFRGEKSGVACKHILSLVAVGLIPRRSF